MAITWGSIVGGYGKIGYEVIQSEESNTTITTTVTIYFASKYSVSDTSNTLYYDKTTTASSAKTSRGSLTISTTVDSGSGWSTSNQVRLKTYVYEDENKTTSAQTRYFYAKLVNVDRVGGTMYVSGTYKIPALAKYTITYNANGGGSTPSSQTKYYGKSVTLAAAITRTGYSFLGWATSASGSVAYPAEATYSGNANLTLYAKWTADTYTVSYNANGGSGAPASQTKTYGIALTLSSTKPTRTNYTFLGWATTKTATTAQYEASGTYTANAGVTLYAVWELAYTPPSIYNLKLNRCTSTGVSDESGTYAKLTCDYICNYSTGADINIAWSSVTGGSGSLAGAVTNTSGSLSKIIGDGTLVSDVSYMVSITFTDTSGSATATTTLPGTIFPFDALAGGNGIAFGKNADKEGVAEFAFDAQFNGAVSGNVMGLNKLPEIPVNSDLNDYMTTGSYACYKNVNAETIANMPVMVAGRLEVCSSTGEGVKDERSSYIRQKYYPYNRSNAVWERDITRNESNVWTYYDWWRSNLTPAASSQIYEKSAITLVLTSNVALGVANAYTALPFGKAAHSMGSKLSLSNACVLIGSGVDYVRVSGQTLVQCGSIVGVRHVRIQKISGGTTESIMWTRIYAAASSSTIYPLTPMVIPVAEGDLIQMVFYTSDATDSNQAGSLTNGYQTYLTVETI